MTAAGTSAEMQYRSLRWRRWRIRTAVASIGFACAGLGTWLVVLRGALAPGGALWLAAVAAGAVHRWPGLGGRDLDRWERGAQGERGTAALLDAMNRRRWTVRHDLALPASRANLDHLVVGRTGVWVVDTKTTSAAVRTRWGKVYFGDRRLESGAVLWEAEMVADRLAGHLGPDAAGAARLDRVVRPLIAVHEAGRAGNRAGRTRRGDAGRPGRGRGLKRRGGRAGGVPVLYAEDVVARLRRGRRRLTRSQVRLLASAVDQAFPPYRELSRA